MKKFTNKYLETISRAKIAQPPSLNFESQLNDSEKVKAHFKTASFPSANENTEEEWSLYFERGLVKFIAKEEHFASPRYLWP